MGFLDRIFSYLFGLASVIGLVISVVALYNTLQKIRALKVQGAVYEELSTIFLTLTLTIGVLVVCFLVIVWFYSVRINQFAERMGAPSYIERLKEELNYYKLVTKSNAKSLHNILHCYRHITLRIDSFLASTDGLLPEDGNAEEECRQILNHFDTFLLDFLTNITSAFNTLTNDKCASCIKIVKNGRVKTFYRDPISYRSRRTSDYNQDGTPYIYSVSDNYAFNVITSPNFKQNFFACDKLKENKDYFNNNPQWQNLYNATLVVPIGGKLLSSTHQNELQIVGFLCIDNLKGGFEYIEVKDFISGFGDILYNLFVKFDKLIQLINGRCEFHERLRFYNNWNES